MSPSRLPALLILLSAFALAACGNKADLFMPPPPDDEGLVEPVDEQVIEDEAASQRATGLPLPVPTSVDPDPPATLPADDDDADPPPPDPGADG